MILTHLKAAVLAAFPGLDKPKAVLMRVIRQEAARFKLQAIGAADDAPETMTSEVCPGVPGVTSDPTPGEQVVVAFIGADGIPCVVARASQQMPGAVPGEVRHDAKDAIRLLSRDDSAAAKVYVGPAPTFALARAADLEALLAALVTLGETLSASGVPEVAAVGSALSAALAGLTVTPTTKLEAA